MITGIWLQDVMQDDRWAVFTALEERGFDLHVEGVAQGDVLLLQLVGPTGRTFYLTLGPGQAPI